MSALITLAKLTAAFFILRYFSILWLESKTYLFNETSVEEIARRYTVFKPEKAFNHIIRDFRKKYPGHILPDEDLQWIFVNAGGWMGSMCVLHASVTEYVLLFGTAIDTTGHSGRYLANITDTILSGTFTQWKEGELRAETYNGGDTVRHVMGEAAAVHWTANTWMLEYGRGLIPTTLPFALSDTLFGTQDFVTLYRTLRIYCKALWQELLFATGVHV